MSKERAGTSGQEGSTGGRCWDLGVLGICVCVSVPLCLYISRHTARAKIPLGVVCCCHCTPVSTEFFQVSLILVRCETSSAINMDPI